VILSALDRASVIPLYYQIRQRLLDQISSGTLRPGQPIPSEQRISARLRVSRMTARQALRSLCEDGLAYSRRGKGTFVAEQKQERNINQLLSFTEEMKSHGARSRLLSFSAADPDREAARVLQLGRREKVFQIRRVRLADSVPMAIETSCLPVKGKSLPCAAPFTRPLRSVTESSCTLPTRSSRRDWRAATMPACSRSARAAQSFTLRVLVI